MEAISYFEAWGLWWHDVLDPHQMMGPLRIFVWARIGKIVGCLAGLTVILDIVGDKRVREFGKRMGDLITFRTAVVGMFYAFVYAVEEVGVVKHLVYGLGRAAAAVYLGAEPERARRAQRVREWWEWDSKREKLREVEERTQRMMPIGMVLLTLAAVWVALLVITRNESGALAIMLLVLFFGIYMLVVIFVLGPLLTIGHAVVLFLASLALVLSDAVIDRFADVLKRKDNGTVIRTIGIVLFIIGFHLDLLGS